MVKALKLQRQWSKMKSFFLLVLYFSSLCAGNQTHLGTGASLAVCQPDTCTLISELATLREKMETMVQTQNALKESVRRMEQKTYFFEIKLQTSENQSEELKKINQDQQEHLKILQQSLAIGQNNMAFSAALGSSLGPFEQDVPLKYQRILSNIGNGYNPATGVFTAMTQGMYYFSYTMYNNNSGQPNSAVSLMLNSQKLVSTWNTERANSQESATNAAVVQLMAGDSVFVKLYANRVLYDDEYYYNTFSGFLLFPL